MLEQLLDEFYAIKCKCCSSAYPYEVWQEELFRKSTEIRQLEELLGL